VTLVRNEHSQKQCPDPQAIMPLTGATCPAPNLAQDDLESSNLSKATIYTSNLSGANLAGANLTDTDLGGSNLTNAVMVNLKDLGRPIEPGDSQWRHLSRDNRKASQLAEIVAVR
jgi:hypothetical protein